MGTTGTNRTGERIEFPLVRSKRPGLLYLNNQIIDDILTAEDASAITPIRRRHKERQSRPKKINSTAGRVTERDHHLELAMTHQNHDFELILADAEGSEAEANALYEAGCDDGTVGTCNGVTSILFTRRASSLEQAIRSAIAHVQAAGLRVARVVIEPESLAHAE